MSWLGAAAWQTAADYPGSLAKEDRDRLRLYLDEYISLQVHEVRIENAR